MIGLSVAGATSSAGAPKVNSRDAKVVLRQSPPSSRTAASRVEPGWMANGERPEEHETASVPPHSLVSNASVAVCGAISVRTWPDGRVHNEITRFRAEIRLAQVTQAEEHVHVAPDAREHASRAAEAAAAVPLGYEEVGTAVVGDVRRTDEHVDPEGIASCIRSQPEVVIANPYDQPLLS
jgi:hypothetical protein